jgi:hypothetical protein
VIAKTDFVGAPTNRNQTVGTKFDGHALIKCSFPPNGLSMHRAYSSVSLLEIWNPDGLLNIDDASRAL